MQLNLGQSDAIRTHTERTVLFRVVTTTVALHAVLLMALAWNHWQPARLGTGAIQPEGNIGAFIMSAPQPVATTGAAPRQPRTPRPADARPAPAVSTAQGVGDA